MKNKNGLLNLFKNNTGGKTEISPKEESHNPAGYQVSRVQDIIRYGYGGGD